MNEMKTIEQQIAELKVERNAVILVHNYQRGEVQDIGDFVGDSLELSRKAAASEAEVIVFCGVLFMAETAKILSPEATVLMPDINAGCPMANMATVRELRNMKRKHPDAAVVCYVNSSAEVKAESNVCCTSANAVKVVQSIPTDREIIFVPDRNLGAYVAEVTGRKMILWEGYCPTHERITPEHIFRLKEKRPAARVVVHPECVAEAIALADMVGSTSGILKYCHGSNAHEFIIGTEVGIIHRLKKENPGKIFHRVSDAADCPDMKLTTLEKILWSLQDMEYEVTLAENVRVAAKRAIEQMLEIA